MSPANPLTDQLCLKCRLCCDGSLFSAVELQRGDDVAGLKELGLALKKQGGGLRFSQPCSALCGDGRCGIYKDRPTYCRQFECLVLKETKRGKRSAKEALSLIRLARRRTARVNRLLRQLGEESETLSVSERFRKVSRLAHSGGMDADHAAIFSDLTVAYQQLIVLLSASFYPDAE
ncbi:MAG TPA: YkgJ family cysteine cluster protein [Roseimicrobium sp.]|nr:YkgJ family cysteine cluster protein [Roseimicrobium sp.]